MLEDLEQRLSGAIRVVELLSTTNTVSQQAELVRLKRLCARLFITVYAPQTKLPERIKAFCGNPAAKGWSNLQNTISMLGKNVERMFALLKQEEGDFVIDGMETYRSLVSGLSERKLIYQDIEQMNFPPETADLNRLMTIAIDYERLVRSLSESQKGIAAYVKERRIQPSESAMPEKPDVPEWYVSYAWGDDLTPDGRAREEIVDNLCEAAAAQGHRILRDKDALSVGDSISVFMRRIGTGGRIFVILSDKYLRSPHCMFELSEVWRTSRQEGEAFLERVRIYALPDANIFTPIAWADWAIYWKKEHDTLEGRARQHGMFVLGELGHRRLTHMRTFYHQVSDILGTLADIVQPRTLQELQRYGFCDPPKAPRAAEPLRKS